MSTVNLLSGTTATPEEDTISTLSPINMDLLYQALFKFGLISSEHAPTVISAKDVAGELPPKAFEIAPEPTPPVEPDQEKTPITALSIDLTALASGSVYVSRVAEAAASVIVLVVQPESITVTASPTPSGLSTPTTSASSLAALRANYINSMVQNFYNSLEGAIPLLLASKRSPFDMLKTSLLHCIASVRTIGGDLHSAPLEKALAAFKQDAVAWEQLRQSKILDKAGEIFNRLSEQADKAREEDKLAISLVESRLAETQVQAAQVQQAIDIERQATATIMGEIELARQMMAEAQAVLVRAEPLYETGRAKIEELSSRSISLVISETSDFSALVDAKRRLEQSLASTKEGLRAHALAIAEAERKQELSVLVTKPQSHVHK